MDVRVPFFPGEIYVPILKHFIPSIIYASDFVVTIILILCSPFIEDLGSDSKRGKKAIVSR